jgi:hypothetical protein
MENVVGRMVLTPSTGGANFVEMKLDVQECKSIESAQLHLKIAGQKGCAHTCPACL